MNFVKIPKKWFNVSGKDVRLYAAYLDFKCFNSEGKIAKPFSTRKADRHYYRYWAIKLVERGWAIDCHNSIVLKGYKDVWKSLQIEQSINKKNGLRKHTYHKIYTTDLSLERQKYFKEIIHIINSKIAGNKIRQIKWRLNNKQNSNWSNLTETFLSCSSVAELFGFSSKTTGSKYRKIFFQLLKDKRRLKRVELLSEDGEIKKTFRYECQKIAL